MVRSYFWKYRHLLPAKLHHLSVPTIYWRLSSRGESWFFDGLCAVIAFGLKWSAWSYSEAISLSQCETLGRRWLWEEDCCANVRRPPHISSHSQLKRFFGSATKMSLKSHSKVHSCLTLTFSHHPEWGGALGPCLNTMEVEEYFTPKLWFYNLYAGLPLSRWSQFTQFESSCLDIGYIGRGWRWWFWRP